VIAAAPEESDELPIFIPTELPQFAANYVENRPGSSQHTNLLEAGFFKLFFTDPVVEIISNRLLLTIFWTPAMINGANCHILHPCLPAEGINVRASLLQPWCFYGQVIHAS
jgi:hypothetical protein